MANDSPKISRQVSSKSILGETQSCNCGKRRLQKVLNKRVPLTVANVY